MNSYNMRNNPLFLRNQYCANGKWEIPLVKKQEINLSNISLISCADVRYNDNDENRKKGVHFFVDDYRFNRIFDNPQKSLKKYSQYSFFAYARLFPICRHAYVEANGKRCKKQMVWCILASSRPNCLSVCQLGIKLVL